MIVKMSFVVLLNFLHVNTQVSEIITTSKQTLSTTNHHGSKLENSTIPMIDSRSRLSKYLLVDKSTTTSNHSSVTETHPTLGSFNQYILTIVSNYMERWLAKETNTSHSTAQPYDRLKSNIEDDDSIRHTNRRTKPLRLPIFDDVIFFQLWKEISTKNNGNFTLENASTVERNSFKSSLMNRDRGKISERWDYDTSRMKSILVKDARYRSLMKKWITNRRRHARRRRFGLDFSTVSSDASRRLELSNSTPDCESCLNNTSDDEIIKSTTGVRDNNVTACNDSSSANDKSSANNHDHGDPEARFYDPLMPYPEEYPEEYQTIQNGPALIISRTTYTRIPNVTYTTITMVTLPTYRLVEKAENAFAATLFEERSSKSSAYLHADDDRCTSCNKH